MYSREQIEKVRSSIDIVEVIRTYVPSLSVSGRSVRGLCPFHNERTPSFHVQAEKGFFKCFGCGEAGDVISFVSKIEAVPFVEALEKCAAQAGVVLQKERNAVDQRQDDTKEKLYRILETASKLYQKVLWDARLGEAAQAYLDERGVKEDTREQFKLGMAPNSGPSVFEQLVKAGFSFDLCQQAGLVARSKSGRFYDPLFGRLIFPIWDSFGHPVGFGGRILPQTKKSIFGDADETDQDSGPKYINSPDSMVFQKGRLLYGLNQGKSEILRSRRAVIMEGYMDVIGVHQAGFTTAIATLGTAFTRDHAKLIRRYADEVVVFFDFDEAGKKATLRSLEPIIQEGLFPRVVLTQDTLDPDEIILQKGNAIFEGMIKNAPDFVDFLLTTFVSKGTTLTLQQKNDMCAMIMPLIMAAPNDLLRSEWTERLALAMGLNRRSLEDQYVSKKTVSESIQVKRAVDGKVSVPTAQEEYLQLLFAMPVFLSECQADESDFPESRQQQLFRLLKSQYNDLGRVSLPALNEQMPSGDQAWLQQLLLEEKKFDDPHSRRIQLEQALLRKKDKERLAFLSQELRRATVPAPSLHEEYQTLLRRVKGSK